MSTSVVPFVMSNKPFDKAKKLISKRRHETEYLSFTAKVYIDCYAKFLAVL